MRYYVKEEDLYESVAYLINGNEDLRNLCAVPLYLEAIANVVSAEVIPQLEKETAVWDTGVVAELDKVGVERPEDRALSEIPRISVEELIITEPLRKEREAAVREEGSEEEEQLSPYVSLAQVLDRAIDRVWSREFNRGVFSNEKVHEYWDGLGKLACAIDGRGQAKRKAVVVGEFVPEAGLSPILSLGILCQERGWIKFITSLVQLYFAACFLLLYVQNEAVDEAQEYITTFKPGFRVQVKSFLSELSYEPLDTLFPEVQQ